MIQRELARKDTQANNLANLQLEIAKLSVEPGATFNATCSMKGGVKELINSEEKASPEKKEKSA